MHLIGAHGAVHLLGRQEFGKDFTHIRQLVLPLLHMEAPVKPSLPLPTPAAEQPQVRLEPLAVHGSSHKIRQRPNHAGVNKANNKIAQILTSDLKILYVQ